MVVLSGLNWKKKDRIRETAMCVKLNLHFFYKNIVYKYLLAYSYKLIMWYKITLSLNMYGK